MKNVCKVRSGNRNIDMAQSLDITGSVRHFEQVAQFFRDDFSGSRELCDVHLRFVDEAIPAHSVMLSAFSPVFAEKFRKANKCFEVDLKFLNKESVIKVLNFVYFGKVTFRCGDLKDDLETIGYFGIATLQDEVEKKLVQLADEGKCVDVLNLVTANLKTIPHSPSIMLCISDESIRDIVTILHEMFTTNQLTYEEILRMSTKTVITILSSRIVDLKKIDIINMSLKWIYESRLDDHRAANILRGLTFGSMTYAELVNFRDSLIQTAIPVTVGRCVRLKKGANDTLDIVFTYAEASGHYQPISKLPTSLSLSVTNDRTPLGALPSQTNSDASLHSKYKSGYSTSYDVNFDDCATAISFDAADLERLKIMKRKARKM